MDQTINIGIASVFERQESLRKVLDSLTNQADNIFVVLNYGGQEAPEWILYYPNVMHAMGDNRLGSSHKFTMADKCKGWFIPWDDDLVLKTPTALNTLIRFSEDNNCISTLHGKRYDGERPIPSYRRSFTTNIRCLNNWKEDTVVHVGGSGCMVFHTDRFKISLDNFHHKNMSDVECAKVASDQGVPIIAVAHSCNYLEYIPPKGKTIWQTENNDRIQTQILNSFLK